MIAFYFDIGPNSKSVIAVDSVRFLPPCDDTNLSRLPGYEMDYSLGNVRGRAQACLRQSHAAHPGQLVAVQRITGQTQAGSWIHLHQIVLRGHTEHHTQNW